MNPTSTTAARARTIIRATATVPLHTVTTTVRATATVPLGTTTSTIGATATSPPPTITSRRRPGPRLVLLPIVSAMATALLGFGPNLTNPILAADTANTTTPASSPAAPVGPSCAPFGTPAGYNPPRRVDITVGTKPVPAGRPAGWLGWCTGIRQSPIGPVQADWIVLQLDRATLLGSDLCQLGDCQISLAMCVPTRGPDLANYHTGIDRTGPPQITIITSALVVRRRDFAEASSGTPWIYINPHGYAESV